MFTLFVVILEEYIKYRKIPRILPCDAPASINCGEIKRPPEKQIDLMSVVIVLSW